MIVKELINELLDQDMNAEVQVHIEGNTDTMMRRVDAAADCNSKLCICDDLDMYGVMLNSSIHTVYLTVEDIKY